VAFFLAMACAFASLVTSLLYKRSDVSWMTFLLAGPKTIFEPSKYLRSDRLRVPVALFAAGMCLLAIAWLTSWIADNR
jgi:hypothetical protein